MVDTNSTTTPASTMDTIVLSAVDSQYGAPGDDPGTTSARHAATPYVLWWRPRRSIDRPQGGVMWSEGSDPRRVFAPGVFDGTTALVTGAGRGIGRAIALGFADLGANVIIASNEPGELAAVGEEVSALGRECLEVDVNIRDVASVEAMRDASLERFGSVDFVINNAGGQFQANPFAISDNGWRSVIDLNLNGTWNVVSRFVPHLMERRRGSIVNVVHVYCFERGAPMFAHSGAARAGVINLTRSLAPYLEERNVTINALAPGTTVSPAAAANYGFTEDEWRAQPSRSRFADPEDMAAITLFLCTPAARMINGSVVVADAAATQNNWPLLDDLLDEVRDLVTPSSE
jgi:NAD(P)-dependent dehydrogenase (short-subunit alcohol dehydrogenase family)